MTKNYLPFIQRTLTMAAKIANKNFKQTTSLSTKVNDNNQVLTATDLEIGKMIIKEIESSYPDYNIIDEEAGVINKKSNKTWVVDPIDGTSNFANGLPTYGIMIGLIIDNQAVAGGVVLPAFTELYYAQKGLGSFCNKQKIEVSSEPKLLSSLIAYGIDGHQETPEKTVAETATLAKIILNIRNLRTTNSAYDMVQVATGRYGAFLNQTTKIWDNVAIQPIIEEAGGVVTDYWGKPMNYENALNRTHENFTICAGAPQLHQQLQQIIN